MEISHIATERATRAQPVEVADELLVDAPITSNSTPPSPKIAPIPLATALNAKLIFAPAVVGLARLRMLSNSVILGPGLKVTLVEVTYGKPDTVEQSQSGQLL